MVLFGLGSMVTQQAFGQSINFNVNVSGDYGGILPCHVPTLVVTDGDGSTHIKSLYASSSTINLGSNWVSNGGTFVFNSFNPPNQFQGGPAVIPNSQIINYSQNGNEKWWYSAYEICCNGVRYKIEIEVAYSDLTFDGTIDVEITNMGSCE